MRACGTHLRAGEGRVVVLQDVTELRRLETVRQDFVANVSHELRTPVSVIRANAETLLAGALSDPERARQFVEALHRSSERLSALIADLLDISRIDSGEMHIDLQPLAVAPLVRAAIENLGAAAGQKGLDLTADLPDELAARVDERALTQVLVNLLDNALKYTPAGGYIEIRGTSTADGVRIEVRDDGPGIEARLRERIFERFYRVDRGRSREMGGTGLGLSIVKNLVEAMGGRVGVEPNRPRGSVFWILLPNG
jgi:two-component system phosphate regulon sensor histidine kinase PhoR